MKSFMETALLLALWCVVQTAHSDEASTRRGHDAFQYHCTPCHGPGVGDRGRPFLPGTDALNVKYKGAKPPLLEQRTDLTPELVIYVVRHGIKSMPSFRKVTLSDEDLAAIAGYLSKPGK